LSQSKGVHYLLDAFVEVLKQVPDARLDIAGSGGFQEQLLDQNNRLGLRTCVAFHGWSDRPGIQKLLGECRVLAFPSIYPESFGIVGIEAMMHARPVVAFDVGGVGDWLDDGATGRRVPVKDTAALATALVRLLRDDEECLRMGTAARAQAMVRFSAEKHLLALLGVYERAMGGHSGV
jgi:glycosyltransferase involved in cell wall biosynthesis